MSFLKQSKSIYTHIHIFVYGIYTLLLLKAPDIKTYLNKYIVNKLMYIFSFFHFLLIMNKLHCPAVHCQCLSHVTFIINWSLSKKIDTEAWDSLVKASFVTCGVAVVCGSASKISSH